MRPEAPAPPELSSLIQHLMVKIEAISPFLGAIGAVGSEAWRRLQAGQEEAR